MKFDLRRTLFVLGILAVNLAADRITKIIAEAYLTGKGTFEVLGNFFILVLARNQGAFLSAGSTMPEPWHFLALTGLPALALIGGTVWLCMRIDIPRHLTIAGACIAGGGFSNVWDRLYYDGRVVDFMNFGIGSLRTGILNVADLSITFGALYLIIAPQKKKPIAA